MMKRQIVQRAQGQAVILMALAIVVLVAMAGLGVDGANAFNRRRNASNAADAAAMSGANALIQQQGLSPVGPSSAIYSTVSTYLSTHGIDPTDPSNPWTAYYVDGTGARLGAVSNSSTQINTSARGVSVDVRNTFGTWFMPVLGRSTLTVGATGTAIFGPHRIDGGDILPITMSKDAAHDMRDNPGASFVFGPDSGAFKVDAGNFGALSLNPNTNDANATGNNADCTNPSSPQENPSYWWCNGTPHSIDTGDWLYGDPGELSGNLRDEVQYRIDHNPIGLIPIYDTSNAAGGNNTKYRIVGFLVVQLVSRDLSGNPKTITAKYMKYVASTGSIDPNAPVTGLYAINLIQ